MEQAEKQLTEQEVLARLAALCSRAEHCTGEMIEKMRRWGVNEDQQERIIAYLVSHKYVDDERYCRFFVRDKMRYNRWGRRKIEQALYVKRVPRDIYAPILDELEVDEYVETLRSLLESKRRTLKSSTAYERNQKLIKFALGRGFEMDVIKKCVDDVDEYPEE